MNKIYPRLFIILVIFLVYVFRHQKSSRRIIKNIWRENMARDTNTTISNLNLKKQVSTTELQQYCPFNITKLQNFRDKWYEYRFLDAVKGYYFRRSRFNKNPMTRETLLKNYEKFGNTLVGRYFNRTNSTNLDLDVLNFILRTKIGNIPNNTAILHLRLGDTSCLECWEKPTTYRNTYVYVYPKTYYQQIIQKLSKENISTIVIVAATYHARGDLEVIYKDSMTYVKLIHNLFIEHGYRVLERINCGTPDEDFIYMASATYFVPGGGQYSKTICKLVAINGGKVFEANPKLIT